MCILTRLINHRLAVQELGGPAAKVYFVQHGSYAAQAQRLLGADVVDANYPMDHTHTAPFLADVVRFIISLFQECQYLISSLGRKQRTRTRTRTKLTGHHRCIQHSQAFVLGLKCGTSPLANLVVNATARIEQLRGPCLSANDTLPI